MTSIRRSAWALVGVVLLAGVAAAADPPTPAERFEQGRTLLAAGDVDGAADAFVEASRAAPGRADYRERATLLRRVQGLRRVIEREKDPGWERAAASLHLFYLENDLPRLAIELGRKAHARRADAETSGRLAEALLAAGENADVTIVVAPFSATSSRHALWHAIALARLGFKDEAARLLGKPAGEDPPPGERYDRARALALLGKADDALAALVACLERTSPVAVEATRARARKEKDFASLVARPAFEKALATETKVQETCSGGSSCAGCPNRGSCAGAKR